MGRKPEFDEVDSLRKAVPSRYLLIGSTAILLNQTPCPALVRVQEARVVLGGVTLSSDDARAMLRRVPREVVQHCTELP